MWSDPYSASTYSRISLYLSAAPAETVSCLAPGHSGIIAADVVVVAVSGERTLASGSDPGSCLALAQSGM